MSDFDAALRATLDRNTEVDAEREAKHDEFERHLIAQQESEQRRQAELAAQRKARHAELAEHLAGLAKRLGESQPGAFVVRNGWSSSGEEFVVKLSTRTLAPPRTLHVEIDHDDDHVLARWSSDLGSAIEMWRLLEVTPEVLTQLVLQVADQTAWQGREPPPFPTPAPAEAG